MSGMLQVAANARGRDLVVGDVHGHFDRLWQALDSVRFDPAIDRLFSVGDLVDRGPQSGQVLEWLAQPWLLAVQGNHEALAVDLVEGRWLDPALYRNAGGAWFIDLPPAEQARYAAAFARLPLAIELQTAQGPVGIVHADCPFSDWRQLREHLQGEPLAKVRETCQWSRTRLQQEDATPIAHLRALIVGHTPLRAIKVLGNVWHIDTGGWANGHFSLLDLASLTPLTR